MPYVKNLPECGFSSGGILTDQYDKCKFLVRSLHANAQGLQIKCSELKFLLISSPKDIVGVCETFLSASTPLTMLDLRAMKYIPRTICQKRRGGKILNILDEWSFRVLSDFSVFEEGICENIFVEVDPLGCDPFIFGSVYRLPFGNPEDFLKF